MTFRFAGSERVYAGTCVGISSAGMVIRTDRAIESGKALEVHMDSHVIPPMTAFVEVMRSFEEDENFNIVAADIKGIKGR